MTALLSYVAADVIASVACSRYYRNGRRPADYAEYNRCLAVSAAALMNWLKTLLADEREGSQVNWSVQLRLIEWCFWATRCMSWAEIRKPRKTPLQS
jgi:hypothetical protein